MRIEAKNTIPVFIVTFYIREFSQSYFSQMVTFCKCTFIYSRNIRSTNFFQIHTEE